MEKSKEKRIDYEKLNRTTKAYILYEIASHGVDPRESLEGTILRRKTSDGEGYKYDIYDKNNKAIIGVNTYVDTIIDALPGYNLVSFYQKKKIEKLLKSEGDSSFDSALKMLYEGDDDKAAFDSIVDIIGGNFDVLGFLFFLKDNKKYMPVRSKIFDERFKLLGISADLQGHCTWEKYNEYNEWLREIKQYLNKYCNSKITLLDAHSFVWILDKVSDYLEDKYTIVEHPKYGKGVLKESQDDLINVEFEKKVKKFKRDVFETGMLKEMPIEFEGAIDKLDKTEKKTAEDYSLNKKAIEVATALLKLIANRTRIITYGELSDMTESKPSPYYEMNMILDNINKICDRLELPYISAMVVNKNTGLPGKGFKDLCVRSFGYSPELEIKDIFIIELDKIGKCEEWPKLAEYIGTEMPAEDEEHLPEEVVEEIDGPILEGAKKTITVNSYERDPKAKKKCKDYYMKRDGHITCQICGFDFGKEYGLEYANRIHIHHILPLSEIGETYVVDPIKDLIPVCPNCHLILHDGKGITVEELKKKLNKL